MDKLRPEMHHRLETVQEQNLSLYPNVDIEQIRTHWLTRFLRLGKYVTGPLKWANEIDNDPEARQRFEREEQQLTDAILRVFDRAYPRPSKKKRKTGSGEDFRMLIVATGPGRRVLDYIERCKERGGYCVGVDALEAVIQYLHNWLVETKYVTEKSHFFVCFATEISRHFPPGHFDVIAWERIGNHVLKDTEWFFALRHEVVELLKPGGRFLLAETVRDLNPPRPERPVDPSSSKFRYVSQYDEALGPSMERETRLTGTCRFADDNYFIGFWRKKKTRNGP